MAHMRLFIFYLNLWKIIEIYLAVCYNIVE